MKHKKALIGFTAGILGVAVLGTVLFFGGNTKKTTKKLGNGKGTIVLEETKVEVEGTGLSKQERTVKITKGGVYDVSGTLTDGQILINIPKDEIIEINLKGIEMVNESEAAIYVEQAGRTKIILEEDSKNTITCGNKIEKDKLEETRNSSEDASGAAIYAKDDLTLLGTGSLEVNGYIHNAVFTKNDLVVEDGNYQITALNDGLKGKDSVTIKGGVMEISAGKDGVKAEEEIVVKNGKISIPYCNEGIEANQITIEDGEIDIVSSDDGINANGGTSNFGGGGSRMMKERKTSDGEMSEQAKDGEKPQMPDGERKEQAEDGEKPQMPDGERKEQSEDGERPQIPDGERKEQAEDGEKPQMPDGEKTEQSQEEETITEMPNLIIRGGTIKISSNGDGLDSNGNLLVEGGTVIIEGPKSNGDGAIDYGAEAGGTCLVNGGTVFALGQSGMAETFEDASKQCSFIHNYEESIEAGTTLTISDEEGNTIYEYTWEKGGNSVVFSSEKLAKGSKITLTAGKDKQEITLSEMAVQSGEQSKGFGADFQKRTDRKTDKNKETETETETGVS